MRFDSFREMLNCYAKDNLTALIFDKSDKKESLTYSQLLDLVDEKKEYLKAQGKTSIGIFCNATPECIATLFAAAELKMQIVMMDESIPYENIIKQIQVADVDIIYADDKDL